MKAFVLPAADRSDFAVGDEVFRFVPSTPPLHASFPLDEAAAAIATFAAGTRGKLVLAID